VRTTLMAAVLLAAAVIGTPAAPASAASPSWTDQTVPTPAGAISGQLRDVTAIAPGDVWAVGSWADSTSTHPLTVHWDGTQWTDVPVGVGTASDRDALVAVDALAPGDVWAVGNVASGVDGAPGAALVLHNGGGAWSTAATVSFSAAASALNDIDLLNGALGWAVGQTTASDGTVRPLILEWQSGIWALVATTNLPVGIRLTSVYAATSTQAWAVGSQQQATGVQTPVILHWDGTSWQVAATPPIAQPGDRVVLSRVAGSSATDVWATGSSCVSTNTAPCKSLALHLSGGSWQVVRSDGAELTGIAARSATDAWVVGYTAFNSSVDTDYVERWDGRQLTADAGVHVAVPLPDPFGDPASALASAAPDGTGGLWAVGWESAHGQPMPSVLHAQ
jgi:hypothetical protein